VLGLQFLDGLFGVSGEQSMICPMALQALQNIISVSFIRRLRRFSNSRNNCYILYIFL